MSKRASPRGGRQGRLAAASAALLVVAAFWQVGWRGELTAAAWRIFSWPLTAPNSN